MAVDRFCRNTVGPPEWECEAMGSVVWVQCTNLSECILNLSIVAPADKGPVVSVTLCVNSINNNLINDNPVSMMR